MESHLVTQSSIRCGHVHNIDWETCRHDQPCLLGVKPLQIITETCKNCLQDNELRDKFHDLETKSSLLSYWYFREPSLYGPSNLGTGACILTSITVEMETILHENWRKEIRRFIKIASCGASTVFLESEGWCLANELENDTGRALLERAMEKIFNSNI
jgi:hypothetical protein